MCYRTKNPDGAAGQVGNVDFRALVSVFKKKSCLIFMFYLYLWINKLLRMWIVSIIHSKNL